MSWIGHLCRHIAQGLQWISTAAHRGGHFAGHFVPLFLSPGQLNAQHRAYYERWYAGRVSIDGIAAEDCRLEPWERAFVEQYGSPQSRWLVLGCGWGREALPIAQAGMTVIGVDLNRKALVAAQRCADQVRASAVFHQADFFKLPYAAASFDVALLTDAMYSAIAGRASRHAWLQEVRRVVSPGGMIALSFIPDRYARTFLRRVSRALIMMLRGLPGTNVQCELGDEYTSGHFFHLFQDPDELRSELAAIGARLHKLDWRQGVVWLSFAANQPDVLADNPGRPVS
ncbi:class I SAM-dependent methyltransferase [Nitrospira moscoviensis]|uniref:Methyltransferase type 11 domain-containing protein n=1 Tax=Nitrospira moscoviensis TaxID=42253 RepID=A0A0K2GD39_NITMO|nr:class I SAM-dependent methyltransferase [Nitrospira moscoviensis]ALA58863.1 hypothetical protein NITMOv2_2450 [Nitrospira moscoviensis]